MPQGYPKKNYEPNRKRPSTPIVSEMFQKVIRHLPCLNPYCKSHGSPHPNCRCYGNYSMMGGPNMAEGGEVDSFCSQARQHSPDCEYFESGGEVPAFDDLPDQQAPAQSAAPEQVPAFDDLPDQSQPQSTVPAFDDLPDEQAPQSTGQRLLGDAEAAGQGALGFVSPLIETKLLGVDPKDIERRAATEGFPGEHALIQGGALAASLFTPYGPLKTAVGIIGHAIPEAVTGAKLLNAAIQGASFVGSDEITKNLLGQKGADPSDTVGTALLHLGFGGIMGMATHGIFSGISKGLDQVGSEAMVNKAEKFLARIAEKGTPVSNALSKIIEVSAAYEGFKHGELGAETASYQLIKKYLGPYIEKIVEKPLGKANEYVSDAIISALLKENALSVPTAAKWGKALASGAKSYIPGIESLFTAGEAKLAPSISDRMRSDVMKNIEEGGAQTQLQNQLNHHPALPVGFAKGGMAIPKDPEISTEPDHFGTLFPEQNVLLNQAKGRIYGYLNSIRPTNNAPKLPFDKEPSSKEKERSYKKAIDLAINPISILDHVNNGDLTPEHLKHFTQMYPEVHGLLSKKITERIMKAQLKEEMPSYKKRQAMSLFLGASLDGTLTPMAIQTAQGVFAQKQAAQQQPAPKKKKAALSKASDSYLTPDQSREKRLQS